MSGKGKSKSPSKSMINSQNAALVVGVLLVLVFAYANLTIPENPICDAIPVNSILVNAILLVIATNPVTIKMFGSDKSSKGAWLQALSMATLFVIVNKVMPKATNFAVCKSDKVLVEVSYE